MVTLINFKYININRTGLYIYDLWLFEHFLIEDLDNLNVDLRRFYF